MKRLLVAEDSSSSAMLVRAVFANPTASMGSAEVIHVDSPHAALSAMEQPATTPFDVVLLDPSLPDSMDMETLSRFRERFSDVAVIVLRGTADEARGFEAVARGAQDFLFNDETDPKLLVRQATYARQRKLQELAFGGARERASERAYEQRG